LKLPNPKGSLFLQAERGSGGNSARATTDFGQNLFEYFQMHTAMWDMARPFQIFLKIAILAIL
jgi:hypothetical protein